MKKILFISQVDPFANNGGAYSNRAQIDCFKELGFNLILVIPETDNLIPYEYESIEIIKVPKRNLSDKILGIFSLKIHRFSPFVENWHRANSHHTFSFVYISGGIVSGDLAPFFKSQGVPVITLHNNVEIKYYISAKTKLTLWGHYDGFIKRKEQKAIKNSDLNLTVTFEDLQAFRDIYLLNESDNLVYWGCFEFKDKKSPLKKKINRDNIEIAVCGTLSDNQTFESIISIHSILEELTQRNSIKITIAGRNPSKKLYDLFQNNKKVEIIPSPIDMDTIISQADIFLNPVRFGSGLKLRNMDALRIGIPCIVHRISSYGYEPLFNYDWFKIYDRNDQLIPLILKTVKQCNDFSDNEIQNAYKKYFSFRSGVLKLKEILESYNFLNT